MATRQPSTLKRLWWKWKMLELPWRRQRLVGFDLAGNTFWEFQDKLNVGRMRRIVKYGTETHYADIKITPSWMQWLRHTRPTPPSLPEQQADQIRQHNMKQLAAEADARWASKPSMLDQPSRAQAKTGAVLKDPGGYAGQTEPEAKQGVRNLAGSQEDVMGVSQGKDVDQGRFRAGPSRDKDIGLGMGGRTPDKEPEGWKPSAARRS